MALKLPPPPPLTIFSPQPHTTRPSTELRFSRWNNANAEKFNEKRRSQQEIEDEIRRERRFEAATRIAENYQNATPSSPTSTPPDFKSIGTPSSPSRPSIPGKKSKYSKTLNPTNPKYTHPAFSKSFKSPKFAISKLPVDAPTGVQVSETGVSYKVQNAPFEFQYSYTETPKVKPLALREPPFDPFGPATMPRPWTGRAPLPPSKKKLPEFDSFKLPPPDKKGVKPVQKPGPFLAGMGPKYVKSREEVLGEPLTEEEIADLVQGCIKTRRQLNMGRDGLTHNMLDNIHAHWKRRRVCKIKCKGVCTVDMDNVKHQLEEKTGGKIIYSRGGVLFLFRGRNYNYRSRPRFPIMLWKPVSPIYPRLIQQAPEGLTLEEAKEMRKKGRELQPICKLGKNGVYTGLVNNVREAFEECELVRINCEGMNGSDYKKIGGKLKDLVPCVLISFEYEHILMWRGPEWKSSFPKLKGSSLDENINKPLNISDSFSEEHEETSNPLVESSLNSGMVLESPNANLSFSDTEDGTESPSATSMASSVTATDDSTVSDCIESNVDQSANLIVVPSVDKCASSHGIVHSSGEESETTSTAPEDPADSAIDGEETQDNLLDSSNEVQNIAETRKPFMEGVLMLQKKAIESGSAILLDDASLDADVVYRRSVAFAKGTPPGPIFRNSVRKVLVRTRVNKVNDDSVEKEIITVTAEAVEKKSYKNQKLKDFREVFPDTLPYGSLGVDELAKLLG